MPELPEVQTITTDLAKHVENAQIRGVIIDNAFKTSPGLAKKLAGKQVKKVERLAKNIVFTLDQDNYLVIHLAMTGQLLLRKTSHKPDRHTRIVFSLEKDGKPGELRYTDMRMFGKVKLLNKAEMATLKQKYGPDPISDPITGEKLLEILQGKRTNVKNALLDQGLISGVGNIYANDALFMARVHPETKTKDLTLPMTVNLLAALKEILLKSIENRGSTLKDKMYVDIFGRQGKHQDHFRVYGKDLCNRCQGKVNFKKINGRGTYFCEICQNKGAQEKLL